MTARKNRAEKVVAEIFDWRLVRPARRRRRQKRGTKSWFGITWFRASTEKLRWRPASSRRAGSGRRRATRRTNRRQVPFWRAIAWRRVCVIGATAIVVGGVIGMWRSGAIASAHETIQETVVRLTAGAGFTVDEILVEGRTRTPMTALREALAVDHGDPLMLLDPAAARTRLEDIGWIESAAVERRPPNLVYVRLVERQPMALWQHEGHVTVVDRGGQVIAGAIVDKHRDLPLVVGMDAQTTASDLIDIMATDPGLRDKVAAAVRVGDRRWNLRLDNGIDVRLPESDIAAAWGKLVDLRRSDRLLDRDITVIDLRFPDRIIVRVSGEDSGPETETQRGSDA